MPAKEPVVVMPTPDAVIMIGKVPDVAVPELPVDSLGVAPIAADLAGWEALAMRLFSRTRLHGQWQ